MKHASRAFGILAVALGLLSLPSSVFAQLDYRGGPLNARQHGYQHGYQDGYESGRVSNLSNKEQDLRNQRLKAQGNGYQPAFGSEAEYSAGYRQGFDDGSSDVSNGVRSRLEELFRWQDPKANPDRSRLDPSDRIYGNSRWNLEHVAADIGYRDGVAAGSQDRKQRRRYQPRQRVAWKNGIHGYEPALGSQAAYRAAYRTAYEQGYQDGFGASR